MDKVLVSNIVCNSPQLKETVDHFLSAFIRRIMLHKALVPGKGRWKLYWGITAGGEGGL